MPVVTDIDADFAKAQIEYGVAQVSRPEVKLLPKSRCDMWNMRLPVLAEVNSFTIDDCRRVVVDPLRLDLIYRHDQGQLQFLRQRLHQLNRLPVGNWFRKVIPARRLLGAEIRAVENLLKARDLGACCGSMADHRNVLVDHGPLARFEGLVDAL